MESGPPRPFASSRAFAWAPIVAAIVLAYANTFSAPFVFDDIAAVTQNPSIRRFTTAWSPPDGLSVTGRPFANLTLAFSHALSGEKPWGYHAVNLALHVSSALMLFGIARRTLVRPRLAGKFGAVAPPLAFVIALLWGLHPLQTAAVTYVMQRTELLVGWCCLLTLYAFIRAADFSPAGEAEVSRAQNAWLVVAVAACVCGMASKEAMVATPLLVLLYDRTFVAGGFRAAWSRRKRFHLALAASWLVLAALLVGTGGRSGSAGFAAGVSPFDYARTQFFALAHYLRLALWPRPLVFDYGDELVTGFGEIWPGIVVVSALLVGTVLALRRWPALGFVAVFFFALLAPSSSIVPVATQTIAEHRMYLPLATVVTVAACGLYLWLGRVSFAICGLAALASGVLTFQRNSDYRSERSIWEDTVAKRPANARARYNLGLALLLANDLPGGAAELGEAVRLQPGHLPARLKLGEASLNLGKIPDAVGHFEKAVQLDAGNAEAHDGLARALAAAGRASDALPHFERAAQLNPRSGIAHLNLANALLQSGRASDALAELESALRLQPSSSEVLYARGNALASLGRLPEAILSYQESLRLAPDRPEIHYNLGNALAQSGRYEEALAEFEATVKLDPGSASARNNRSRLRAYLGK